MILEQQSFCINLVSIGQWVFSRQTSENRPFHLKACIAYKCTTLHCATAQQCDKHVLSIVSLVLGLRFHAGIKG
jgi:hypothetical protein